MPPDRLSPMDASFLHIEDAVSHMHIGCVSIMEGPPPPFEALVAMVAGNLPLVQRYRQVVRRVPFDLGRPVWIDDPGFDIGYHIRHTALPGAGGMAELERLVGRVMGQQLDRNRPLWEMWMVEGLEDGEWAIVSKVHHCMADGISGSDLLGLILNPSPDAQPQDPGGWMARPLPPDWELAASALTSMFTSPFELLRLARAQTRGPRKALSQLGDLVSGTLSAATSMRTQNDSCLNGPVGPHRRWVPAEVAVAEVKRVRKALGGTFNDVVLALITRGFRDLLESRGVEPTAPLHTLVPVSVHAHDSAGRAIGDGALSNRVSAMFAELPVGLADPAERLAAITAQMAGLKESKQALAGEALTSLGGFAPPALLSLAGRLGARVSQSRINTVTTNVPGPQMPLYAVGRRMRTVFPYVPVGIQVQIGVAIFSYDGRVGFGITGDYDGAPDIAVVADGIRAGMAELLACQPPGTVVDLRAGRRAGQRVRTTKSS